MEEFITLSPNPREKSVMPFTRYFGVFNPTDLAIIQKVFNQLCEERRLAQKDRDEREALAAEVVRVFQYGITAEGDLWQSVSRRRKAKDVITP
ncbi:hypothetical protein [Kumtagia ephedrae]|uniref:hypothetical protein n=1 Tax=Kumtagia ephedrae TaxID=2116701 RepID=UPI001A9C705A|nr:hypothetical protein [Mesorhizobium ephedrae]